MTKKKKKRLLNGIMVLLILVIAASGIFTVGKLQGWFENPKEAVLVSGTVRGIAGIERKGIGYTLKGDTVLQQEDKLETKKGAEAELVWQETAGFVLNATTQVTLGACGEEGIAFEIRQGEVFGDALEKHQNLEVTFGQNRAVLSASVFSISVQSASSSLSLYAGDVSVYLADGTQERVEAGEVLSVVEAEDGTVSYEIGKLQLPSLNEFLIRQAQECASADRLCVTSAELQSVLDEREAEKQAALEAGLNGENIGRNEPSSEETQQDSTENLSGETEKAEEYEAADTGEEAVYEQEEAAASGAEEEVSDAKICTITILCDTILDNMEELDDGKEAYVPANGTILATSNVEFEEGETVFDVLKRVCDYAGIQLEYSWSPVYNSYYIEGINHLYEFDCGNESGWMYKVNGWFPNYGCSSYSLEDGDTIVWCYTCKGLGADVGGPTF